ncbi:hypothetical protein RND81_01G187200 [Saponaria officinalis]|uniref:Subtilisin-like protease fibronectin type-III domain-containing protein n=1 Tax=Saponaria officinalis TaxID=3572 RepID=A0AAW1NAU5_SAPOF
MVNGVLIVEDCSLLSTSEHVRGQIFVCYEAVDRQIESKFDAAGGKTKSCKTDIVRYTLPVVSVGYEEGLQILAYTKKRKNPTVILSFRRDRVEAKSAPMVATYSSIGPNYWTPEVLKTRYPEGANNPGLVYDASVDDYIQLLCALDYAEELVDVITRGSSTVACANYAGKGPGDFNYLSFSVVFDSGNLYKLYTRMLTNVADLRDVGTYNARVINPNPDEVTITVTPQQLTFSEVNQKQSF